MGCGQRDCIIYLDPARRMHPPGIKRCRRWRLGEPAGCPCPEPVLSRVVEQGPSSVLRVSSPKQGDGFSLDSGCPCREPSDPSLPWAAQQPDPPRTGGAAVGLPAALGSRSGINIPAQVLPRGLPPACPPPGPSGKVCMG